MGAANVINATYPNLLRAAADHQANPLTGFLYLPPAIRIASPPSSVGAVTYTDFREGLVVRRFEAHNRSGGVASVGVGGRIANRHWIAGTLTSENATFTDRTTGYQSRTATIFGADGATNDGVCILSRV